MVKKLFIIIAMLLTAAVVSAEVKQFWQMGEVTDVQDSDVFLLRRRGFHPYSGARNISGVNLKQALTTTGPQGVPGYTPVLGVDYYDGRPGLNGTNGTNGKTYTCFITGGVRTILFDQYGLNPQPSPLFAYSVALYEDGFQVTPSTSAWTTSSTHTLLSGSGAGADFTPAVFDTWSAAKSNNYVTATVTYNGQTCRADAPISVTRIGDTGPMGPAGTPGSPDTQAQILAKIAAQTDGAVLSVQQGATEAGTMPKFQVADRDGNVLLYGDGNGSVFFKDVNGLVRVAIDVNYNTLKYDSLGRLRSSEDTYGQRKVYRGNGVVSFQNTSTAVVIR